MTADTWSAGDAYELYMGRWSRGLAREFIEWLRPAPRAHWLEVGCGTGALTSSISSACDPASIVACDPSASFVEHLRSSLPAARDSFVTASASSLPSRDGGFDTIVSGLVLNFIPEPESALDAMSERARRGGTVAAYIWDYAGGVDLLRCFWEEATALDAKAAELDEARRFARWNAARLDALFRGAGLEQIETSTIAVPTVFSSFEDYWKPFLGGTGPGPSYVAALSEPQRSALGERLRKRLTPERDGAIHMNARAFVVRGQA
jgi:SAM-dependent methyltransferase